MSTVREKIVAMLATVREIRKSMLKINKIKKIDVIVDIVAKHSPIAQKELIKKLPEFSSRTLRRRIDILVEQNQIIRERSGKEVYLINYPQ